MMRKTFFITLTLFFCLSKTMDISKVDANNRLWTAIVAGDSNLVEKAINAGANVNIVKSSETPLLSAAERGYIGIAKLLVQHGAAIDSRGIQGETPLFRAIQGNYLDLVEFLINSGANVNGRDNFGRTPLLLNIESWLAKGTFPNLGLAEQNRLKIIDALARNGADMDAQNKGDTPLHSAAQRNLLNFFTWLLVHGANPHLVNNAGKTPLTILSEKTNSPLLRAILTSNLEQAQEILASHYYGEHFETELDAAISIVAALGYQELVKTIFTHFRSNISADAIASSLIAAAARGNLFLFSTIVVLLDGHIDDDALHNILFWATLNKRSNIVRYLTPLMRPERLTGGIAAAGNLPVFTEFYNFIRQYRPSSLASVVEEALHNAVVHRQLPIIEFIIQHAFVLQEVPDLNPARVGKYIKMLLSQPIPAYETERLTALLEDLAAIARVRSVAGVTETEEGLSVSAFARALLDKGLPIEIIFMILRAMLQPPRQGKPL